MEWIRLDAAFPAHPKVGRLARRLGTRKADAGWLLVSLFCWVGQVREDGDLTDMDPVEIAEGCGWNGDPDKLIAALIECGWVDEVDERLELHEWMTRNGSSLKGRERVKRCRARKREQCNVTETLPKRDCSVTVTPYVRTDVRTDGPSAGAVASAPAALPLSPVVARVPLKDGTAYEITQADIDHWSDVYQGIDVACEVRALAEWNVANKGKRKTRARVLRHITGWLKGEQEKARPAKRDDPGRRDDDSPIDPAERLQQLDAWEQRVRAGDMPDESRERVLREIAEQRAGMRAMLAAATASVCVRAG